MFWCGITCPMKCSCDRIHLPLLFFTLIVLLPWQNIFYLYIVIKTPFTRAKKIGTTRQIFGTVLTSLRHGTPNFRRVKRMGPKCNVGPVLKILGVPRLPPGGSLGTGKRGTMPKIWRAVPIFLARLNGVKMISRNKMFRHGTKLISRKKMLHDHGGKMIR